MFFMKIFKFLKGYVIISLKGSSIERFINICARRGIELLRIEKHDKTSARITMYIKDFKNIRSVAYKTHTKVTIQKKCGLRVLMSKYKKRYVLFIGLVLFLAMLLVTSRFIWIVEIDGVEPSDMAMVKTAVEKAGVRAGIAKSKLSSRNEMKDIILNNTKDISWVWVYIKGTKALVQVKKSVVSPNVIDKNIACDIVSMRDCVIKSVMVKQGVSYVKVGNAVLAGDVLIAGTVPSKIFDYRLVHALGDVRAFTYHKKTGEYKLYNEIRKPTGNKKMHITLNLFSKSVKIFKNSSISYKDYDTIENNQELCFGKDNYIGIGINIVTYKEVDVIREPLAYQTAIEIAKNDLEEKISKELIAGATLQKENIKDEKIDNDSIKVTLEMEFLENVGTEQQIVVNK